MPRKKTKISGVFEKNKGSGIWYIRYRKDGKSKREMIGSYDDAVAEPAKAKLRESCRGTLALKLETA